MNRPLTAVAVMIPLPGFLSLWLAPASRDRVWPVVFELVVGTGFLAAGATVLGVDRASTPGRLFAAAATALLVAPLVPARAGDVCAVVALMLLIPPALLRVAGTRRARWLLRLVDVLLAAAAATGAVATATGAGGLLQLMVVLSVAVLVTGGWVLFEVTSGDDRRRVLWVVLGVCTCAPAIFLFLVAADRLPLGPVGVATVTACLALVLPLSSALALVAPRAADVREVIRRVVVLAVMLALSVAAFEGGAAVFEVAGGRPPGRAASALLAAAVALGFQPTRAVVQATMDELLFGGRAEPIETLSRVGAHLTAGSSPPEWLEALRTALGVPAIVLRQGEQDAAVAGHPGAGETAVTPLHAGSDHVGDLVVTLPADQMRLQPATAAVLVLVAVPLAQALHAARLSDQLRHSQGRVVAALEEERRRMRRDLHDGLGPTLTGIAYSADAASNLMRTDPDQALDLLRLLRSDAGDAIAEVRRIVYGLRPKALDELGLVGAIRQRVSHLRAADGRDLTVAVTAPVLPDLPAAVEVAAYRMAVEAVTNVARHAAVPAATVALTLLDGPALQIAVTDPGSPPDSWRPGVGLTTMRERVEQIGGTLTLEATPAGCTVRATLPFHPEEKGAYP